MLPPSWKAEVQKAVEESTNADREKREAQANDAAGKITAVIKALSDAQNTQTAHEDRNQKTSAKLSGITIFLVFLTVIFTGASWWVFNGQLNEMRSEQRPVLWTGGNLGTPLLYTNPQNGQGQVYWTVHFTNYGRGFASSGTAQTFIKLGDAPFEKSYGQPNFSVLSPVAPNQDMFLTVISKPGTAPDDFAALSKREDAFSVKFEIRYLDLAGTTFETGFCLIKLLSGAIKYCATDNYVK
jgi:hypothetical protein